MTDDANANSTDDNLADPAQVVPREPRSPVEAAADPAHGGGMPTLDCAVAGPQGRSAIRPDDIVDAPNPYALPGPMVMGAGKVGPTSDADGVVPPNPKRQEPTSSSARTILSGVDRIFAAMENGVDVAAELDSLVGTLAGEAKSAAAEVERATDSTVAQVHSAADAIEALFSRMADLVKRAKAAHG